MKILINFDKLLSWMNYADSKNRISQDCMKNG